MKKLLLTTTALAGMTGAAVADVSLSGTGTINLRTDTAANTWSSDASLVASMSSSGAYAAAVTINIAEWGTDGNAKGSGTGQPASSNSCCNIDSTDGNINSIR